MSSAVRATAHDVSLRQAPASMLWVAWRQHRLQVFVILGVAAVFCAALIAFHFRITTTWARLGCELFPKPTAGGEPACVDATHTAVWWNDGFSMQSGFLRGAMLLGPIGFGVLAAAPIFTREFGHGTQVFALTQSVGRLRWFVAKTVVVLVPLTAALLAAGLLMDWVDQTIGMTAMGQLNPTNFLIHAMVPAGIGVAAYGATVLIGVLSRNIVTTLVVGVIAAGFVLYGLMAVQPHVLPADRITIPISEAYGAVTQAEIDAGWTPGDVLSAEPVDANSWTVGGGFLDAAGDRVSLSASEVVPCYDAASNAGEAAAKKAGLDSDDSAQTATTDGSGNVSVVGEVDIYSSATYMNASNAAMRGCLASHGIDAQYVDIQPGSMLWPLRWTMTAICVILAALFVAVAAWRLPRAVAQR